LAFCRNADQANQAGVTLATSDGEFSKVLIDSGKYAALSRGHSHQFFITWIAGSLFDIEHIVTQRA
jgi:hypothetical protein